MSKAITVKSTYGTTFTLLKSRMKGATYNASRSEIAKAFRPPTLTVQYQIGDEHYNYGARVRHYPQSRSIGIGCQEFVGKDYLTLKRWAVAKVTRKK